MQCFFNYFLSLNSLNFVRVNICRCVCFHVEQCVPLDAHAVYFGTHQSVSVGRALHLPHPVAVFGPPVTPNHSLLFAACCDY